MSVRLTRALAEDITPLKLSNDRIIALLGESPGRDGSTRAEIAAIRGWRSEEVTHTRVLLFCDTIGTDPFWAMACPWGPYGRLAS